MHAPQIILIVLNALGLGASLVKNEGRDFPVKLVGTGLVFGILYWGGFFG